MMRHLMAIKEVQENGSPQLKSIVRWMLEHQSISFLEGLLHLQVHALPKRITELEEYGIKIDRIWREDKKGSKYIRYFLPKSSSAGDPNSAPLPEGSGNEGDIPQ